MTFVKYKNSNNASTKLIADISASATTILITDWEQALFPNEFPFLLTIEHRNSDWNVIVREIVKATAWNQNSFIVERSSWTCVQDDTATTRVQANTAHSFSTWDSVSLYRTAEQVKDIQDAISNLEVNSAKATSIAEEYDDTATYSIWDVVMYQWERFVCNTDIQTAETFDPVKWTKTSVQTDFESVQAIAEEVAPVVWSLWVLKVIDLIAVWGWWAGWQAWCNPSNWSVWWWWGWWWDVFAWLYLWTSTSYDVVIWCWWKTNSWKCCFTCACFFAYCWWNDWWDTHFWPLVVKWWKWWSLCVNVMKMKWWDSWAWYVWVEWYCTFGGWGGWWWASWAWERCVWSSTNCYWMWWSWWHWKCWYGWGWWWWWDCRCWWCAYDWWWAWWDNTCWRWCNATNCWWGWWWWAVYSAQACLMPWWCWAWWIVIVKYPADWSWSICCATWWTITTETIWDVEYCVHTFTSNWTFCIIC